MKMQTITELCPTVEPTKDRSVFLVKSRSTGKRWRVDAESRYGLMSCECPDFNLNKNRECYHIWQVRKFISIVAMQGIIRSHEKPPTNPTKSLAHE